MKNPKSKVGLQPKVDLKYNQVMPYVAQVMDILAVPYGRGVLYTTDVGCLDLDLYLSPLDEDHECLYYKAIVSDLIKLPLRKPSSDIRKMLTSALSSDKRFLQIWHPESDEHVTFKHPSMKIYDRECYGFTVSKFCEGKISLKQLIDSSILYVAKENFKKKRNKDKKS